MHGGMSTGPRTPEGPARSRRAAWIHGLHGGGAGGARTATGGVSRTPGTPPLARSGGLPLPENRWKRASAVSNAEGTSSVPASQRQICIVDEIVHVVVLPVAQLLDTGLPFASNVVVHVTPDVVEL
jgi:hypothetical protein